MFKLLICFNLIVFALAGSDCYYDFLEPENGNSNCGSTMDCFGPNSTCIFSINKARRICCQQKKGTVYPQCPTGYTSSELTMPIMCQPNNEYMGVCPDDYECIKSATVYTPNMAFDGPKENYMCCKKI